ncbi:MAG: flagellar basal body P-ring formation chaperone FlgA [Rickettsiales bacterium]
MYKTLAAACIFLCSASAAARAADGALPPLPPSGSAQKYALLQALGENDRISEKEAEKIAVGDMLGVGPSPLASSVTASIDPSILEDLLRPHFDEKNLPEPYGIEFYGAAKNGFSVELPSPSYKAEVEKFDFDENSYRFQAEIAFRNENDASAKEEKFIVKGKAEQMLYVLAPRRDVMRGDAIDERDVVKTAIPLRRGRQGDVADLADVAGKVAKRRLRQGEPIFARDVEEETLVARNASIDIEYVAPFITLKTSGKALEKGVKGDVVRARSDASGKIVQVMVTAENSARLIAEAN